MSDDARAGAPRILICSLSAADATGTARSLAGELSRRRPDAGIVVATDSAGLAPLEWPANVELIKLPSPGSGFPAHGHCALCDALLIETVRGLDPHLIVIDGTFHRGSDGLDRALSTARGHEPHAAVALCVSSRRGNQPPWDEIEMLLTGGGDRILVYGDSEIDGPSRDDGITVTLRQRMTFCGYPERPAPRTEPLAMRARYAEHDRPLAVVVVDEVAQFERFAEALRSLDSGLNGSVTVVVPGIGLTAEERAELSAMVGRGPALIEGDPDELFELLMASDVALLLGGDHALLDAVAARKRPIVVTAGDRSGALARLGLATLLDAARVTSDDLTASIGNELASQSSPPELLEFTGVRRAAGEIIEMLDRLQPFWPSRGLHSIPATYRARPLAVSPLAAGEQIVTGWDGTRFYADVGNLIEKDIVFTGGFEVEVQREIAHYLLPGDVVLDCGANIGAHACPFARRVGRDGLVIAVEPVPFLADRLEANRRLNGLEHMAIVRKAVSSAAGMRELYAPEPATWNLGNGSFHTVSGPPIAVETVTIDELVEEFALSSLKLIKLDIEGHEVDALHGAYHVLQTLRPYVLFEYLADVWDPAGRTLQDATKLLMETHGYRIRPINWQASLQFQMVLGTPPRAS